MATKPRKKGIGKWVARTMEIYQPGAPGQTVEAIGIYNTETKDFKIVETIGESFDDFLDENPDEDRDDLLETYQREAEDWASNHNSNGWLQGSGTSSHLRNLSTPVAPQRNLADPITKHVSTICLDEDGLASRMWVNKLQDELPIGPNCKYQFVVCVRPPLRRGNSLCLDLRTKPQASGISAQSLSGEFNGHQPLDGLAPADSIGRDL